MKSKLLESGKTRTFEFGEWLLQCYQIALLVVVIYRPPTSCAHQPFGNFLDEFGDYLSSVLSKHKNVLLMGDFNVKFNKPEDSDTCSLMDMFYNFDLKQYIQCSTHTSGNTLDLIVARDNSDLDISTPTESWYISDHCFIECNLKFSKPHSEKSVSVIEKLKTFTVSSLQMIYKKLCKIWKIFRIYQSWLSSIMLGSVNVWIHMHL